ncbi:putative sodium/potassium/calcium exchanger CG1090 isoform X2 [Oratosquilla oratoria]|uniref:putative sodium/potassium/calcium exchanger CG1090 isoform X2 n=1 Tax=Oratosquilla oratoria TaxID=337810 RepID=UPI003F76A7DE
MTGLAGRLGIRSRRSRLGRVLLSFACFLIIGALFSHGTGPMHGLEAEWGRQQIAPAGSHSTPGHEFTPKEHQFLHRHLLEDDEEEAVISSEENPSPPAAAHPENHPSPSVHSPEAIPPTPHPPPVPSSPETKPPPPPPATSPDTKLPPVSVTTLLKMESSSSPSSSSTTTVSSNSYFVDRSENCTTPAIEQFPPPLMSANARKNGGLIVHIIISMYMFVAIAIVCDEYFVPSLEMICDTLQLSEDVAGATFMAAGSSAPELATAFIAVFVAKDDIGVSGVIGSAVFNIMFVISICALFAGQVIHLNWWPLIRDCTFYCISIVALLLTIYNEVVSWYESVFLLLLYILYCILMVYNSRMEEWANTLNLPFKRATREEKSSLFAGKVPPTGTGDQAKTPIGPDGQPHPDGTTGMDSDPAAMTKRPDMEEVESSQPKSMVPDMKDEDASPWEMPVGVWERIVWVTTLPLVAIHHVTMPDCRTTRWRRFYLVTFIMSMIWIAAYSYVMVWMITIIGYTLGIPDTVMGLTFIAVGVSAPDALSSLCVAKQGFGDMAVSNAIGSNVFDILLCLGFPWFLKTVIVDPGSTVTVESRGLTYSTVSLFSTVVFLIVVTHLNGWKMDKKYGILLLIWYLIFMIFASLYELNVFGDFNPPECISPY